MREGGVLGGRGGGAAGPSVLKSSIRVHVCSELAIKQNENMLSLPPRRFARQAVRSAAFAAVIGPHVLTISVSGTLLGRALIAITHRPF